MCALIWVMVGVIMLTITIWVHRHTYGVIYKHGEHGEHGEYVADLDDPAPFPRWLLLSAVVVSLIPVVNVILFIVGMMEWIINYVEDDVRLGNLPKWFKSVQEFLTKQV